MKGFLTSAILVLGFIGLADAWYLASTALNGGVLTCDLGVLDGCNTVAQSPYSKLLGLPIALYGVGYYAAVFALAGLLVFAPSRSVYKTLFALSAFGALASTYFMGLQLLVIQAACVYCVLSVVVAYLVFFASAWLWKGHRHTKLVVLP